jgi:hypothetical protein
MIRAPATFLGLLVLFAAGCGGGGHRTTTTTAARPGSASALASVHGRYSPKIDVANFVSRVDNPLWPLKPGTAYHYDGTRGKTHKRTTRS